MSDSNEFYDRGDDANHQVLAYLSRYLFWLVMAALGAGFTLLI
ncbi:MAG: hypothetical protein AAF515_15060 [Pseudomonadota bacterium]